jgi:hypothetical protein
MTVNMHGVYPLKSEVEELLPLLHQRRILSRIVTFHWTNDYDFALPIWMADQQHFRLLCDVLHVTFPHISNQYN